MVQTLFEFTIRYNLPIKTVILEVSIYMRMYGLGKIKKCLIEGNTILVIYIEYV